MKCIVVVELKMYLQCKYGWLHAYNTGFEKCRAAKLRLLNFLSLFRDLQKPTRFSRGGGGGVVAEFLRGLREPTPLAGGGSSRIFPLSPVAKSNVCPTLSDIRG